MHNHFPLSILPFSEGEELGRTLRSSNNLYDGTKGFCPVGGATFLLADGTTASPFRAETGFPLAGTELTCCDVPIPCEYMVVAVEADCCSDGYA